MTPDQIKKLSDKEFRDWMKRLIDDHKFKEVSVVCKIRLGIKE